MRAYPQCFFRFRFVFFCLYKHLGVWLFNRMVLPLSRYHTPYGERVVNVRNIDEGRRSSWRRYRGFLARTRRRSPTSSHAHTHIMLIWFDYYYPALDSSCSHCYMLAINVETNHQNEFLVSTRTLLRMWADKDVASSPFDSVCRREKLWSFSGKRCSSHHISSVHICRPLFLSSKSFSFREFMKICFGDSMAVRYEWHVFHHISK